MKCPKYDEKRILFHGPCGRPLLKKKSWALGALNSVEKISLCNLYHILYACAEKERGIPNALLIDMKCTKWDKTGLFLSL